MSLLSMGARGLVEPSMHHLVILVVVIVILVLVVVVILVFMFVVIVILVFVLLLFLLFNFRQGQPRVVEVRELPIAIDLKPQLRNTIQNGRCLAIFRDGSFQQKCRSAPRSFPMTLI